MNGLLSGLIAVVGIVGAVFTGGALGIVAGSILATSFAAQHGWLGGGMKKFFSSGFGKDLTTIVGIASAAMGAYNAISAVSSAADVADAATTAAAAEGPATDTTAAITAQNAASGAGAASTAGAADGTVSGFMAQNMTGGNQFASALSGGNPEAVTPGLTAQEISGTNNALDQAWINAGSPGAGPPTDPAGAQTAAANLGVNNNTPAGAAQSATAADAQAVNTTGPQAGATAPPAAGAPGNYDGSAGNTAPGTAATAAKPGLMSQAIGALNKNPGLATMGGNIISGIGQGMAQQKMIQAQIAAQQWGNMQWQDPNQVQNLQNAAAAPITVPSGYLSRALAVRGLMTGGTQQTGPVTGVQPTPTAPAPTVAPVGMGGAPGGGPVPIAGMNSTPRGGTI